MLSLDLQTHFRHKIRNNNNNNNKKLFHKKNKKKCKKLF